MMRICCVLLLFFLTLYWKEFNQKRKQALLWTQTLKKIGNDRIIFRHYYEQFAFLEETKMPDI